jgi:hypothetical protein
MFICFVCCLAPTLRATAADSSKGSRSRPLARATSFEKTVLPTLTRYCYDCHGNGKHKGDTVLDAWRDEAAAIADQKIWERVLQKVQNHEMPPENKPQPSANEREILTQWIDAKVFHCDCDHPDPGRVTLRRLNRAEYNNTIRDLLGVDFKPAEDFPVDDSGYGFDNIADALSMPPVLIEKYLASAQKITEAALGLSGSQPITNRFAVDLLEVGYNARQHGDGWVFLNSVEEDDVAVNYETLLSGEYALRLRAYARQESTNTIKLTFMLGDQPVKVVAVTTNSAALEIYEARLPLPAGKNRLRAVVRRIKDGLPEREALKWKTGPTQKGAVLVQWLEVAGPFDTTNRASIIARPADPKKQGAIAREFLAHFAPRAFRRPITKDEMKRLNGIATAAWKSGEGFEQGVGLAMQAALVSPHFLFRGELQPDPDDPKQIRPVNEFALASRLSYFLWSSMPDERLFALAEKKALRKNLSIEVQRMLQDPKSRALVENFGGQWLQFRNLEVVAPDKGKFPRFDDSLRHAMRRETELFFEHIMREDRSILDFINADYTFVNERLAQHYGLSNVAGDRFQRVSLRGTQRRGVLTQGSVLTLTSNPTRTSPVKRGKWVLENLLNAPPPPPPPNVPELKEGKELTGTLRHRMEQHRADALCASCHARMDPIGFGLEHFDGIGAWREKDGGESIDTTGALTTGETFDGANGLTAILSQNKREQFVRCLTEKMLTYALGRGLEYYDKCAVNEITSRLAKQDYKFSALVTGIVTSAPFQSRRGDRAKLSSE